MEPPAGEWRRAADDRDPLAALAAARELKEALGRWEAHLARKALAEGETWETIGAALGISRQAAWERLRRGIAEEIEADKERVRAQRERLVEKRKGGTRGRG